MREIGTVGVWSPNPISYVGADGEDGEDGEDEGEIVETPPVERLL